LRKYSIYSSRLKWPKILLICLVIAFVMATAAIVAVRRAYTNNLKPVNNSQRSHLVTIPTGSSVREIGVILEKDGVIRKAWAFEWYVRNKDVRDRLLAGTYSLRPNQSVEEIVTILTQGNIATDLVTILPGQRIDQIKQALMSYGYSEISVDQALNPSNYVDHPALVDKPPQSSLEGYLYPESFQKTAETKPETIIRASLDQIQKYLTAETRASIVKQGLTVHQGVILASIVEQEVGKPEDRKTVAQVFLRRLRENMALESDATASYGAILDDQKPSLSYSSLYNTYQNRGLTPGPISNVSQSSLQAVAFPATTDYLFFVSGDDGITYFSRTLQEHQELTRQHCSELCRAQ